MPCASPVRCVTEACFQSHPLQFINGSQTLRWNGKDGETLNIKGQYVTTGTHPRGSSWAKNPIPRGNQFPPPCGEDPKACGGDGHRTRCKCSGAWGPYNLEIVDKVRVPKVPAGDWVVGFRWVSRHDIAGMWVAFFQECQQYHCVQDCEESAQIWSSCGDITIKPGGYGGLGVGGKPTTERDQRLAGL